MDDRDDEEEDERGGRSALWHYALALVMAGAVVAFVGMSVFRDRAPSRKVQELTIVSLVQPPRPPPPPPPPTPPPDQKMVEQEPVKQEIEEEQMVEQPKLTPQDRPDVRPDAPPPGPLAMDAKATGPGDGFNLGSRPGGRGLIGSGTGNGNGSGNGASRWGWYASIVQSQIEQALRANAKTRNAVMQLQLRLWSDQTGRVTRVQIVLSSGDAEIDAVIRDQVLAGLTLREPPPKDMPMPIVARISERRPS